MVMKIVDSDGASGGGSFKDDLVKLMRKLEPGEGVQVPRSELPRNYGQVVMELVREQLPFPWHLNEESEESVTFYRDRVQPKVVPAAKPPAQPPAAPPPPPEKKPAPDGAAVYGSSQDSVRKLIEDVRTRGGRFPVPRRWFADDIARAFCACELKRLGYRVDRGRDFDVVHEPKPVPAPRAKPDRERLAPKATLGVRPGTKVPMRDRILTIVRKTPDINHSVLGNRICHGRKERVEFNQALARLISDREIVDTVIPWRGPLKMKTTYRLVEGAPAPPPVRPSAPDRPSRPVETEPTTPPAPVVAASAVTVQPKPEAKPITREAIAHVQKMIKPEKFPTGNKCYACVDEDHVRVCGETASVTYKHVRLCRTHMKRLEYARKIYVRTSLKHNPILLKKQ